MAELLLARSDPSSIVILPMIERAPHRFWQSAAITHLGRERSDLDEVACAIVEMANHRGGPDNITAVLVRAEERL